MIKKVFFLLFIIIPASYTSALPPGFFELNYSHRYPLQLEMISTYYHRTLYYDEIEKKMKKFPDKPVDWHYERLKVKFRIGWNFTYNLRVRFTFPYVYSDLLKTDQIGQEIRVNRGVFTDFEIEVKYDFFKTKQPLWGFWRTGRVYLTYMFDSGRDEDLESYISLGEDSFLVDLRFELLPFPEKYKNLNIQPKIAYEFNGYKRPFVANYSKSGWKDGDQFSYELRISYTVDNYWRIEPYVYGKEWFKSIDLNNSVVDDSDEYERGVGIFLKFRPKGESRNELYFKTWYPLSYKQLYTSFINPEIGIKYMF